MELSEPELNQRKPVWHAMSELFLDTELDDSALEHIAGVFVDSGYSLTELRVILDSEVGPVLYKNLYSVAGVWSGFDEHWLNEQIIAYLKAPKRWQDALLDPIRRLFKPGPNMLHWPELVMKYQAIKRKKGTIEL